MSNKMKFQKDYIGYVTQLVDASTLPGDELEIKLNLAPVSNTGYIILDKGDPIKEETVFYHRKNGSSVFVYGVNRFGPNPHEVNSKVLLVNSIDALNYLSENTFQQMFIYKVSEQDVFIEGGKFFIDNAVVDIASVNTFDGDTNKSLVSNDRNYIHIKDGDYYISTTLLSDQYQVGYVDIDSSGDITGIFRYSVFSISGRGMTDEQVQKLNALNPNAEENIQSDYGETNSSKKSFIKNKPNLGLYEVSTNKSTSIGPTGSNTLFPTTKAVRDELKLLVPKVAGKDLSTNDLTDELKALIESAIQPDGDKELSDNNFTDTLKQKLEALNNYTGVSVVAGNNVTVDKTTNPDGSEEYVVGSLIGATNNIQYRTIANIFSNDRQGKGVEVIYNDWDRYFVLPKGGYGSIDGQVNIPEGSQGITKIRFFCKNKGVSGKIRAQMQVKITNTSGGIQKDFNSDGFLVDIGSGDTFFDIPADKFDDFTFSNVSDLYFNFTRDASSSSTPKDTVNGEVHISSVIVFFDGVQQEISFGDKILTGTGVPDSGLGKNGYMYLDTSTWNIYNKNTGTWNLSGNIKGLDGTNGTDGLDGDDGRSIVSLTRTDGNGAAGTTDQYTITFDTGAPFVYYVYNGADGEGAGDMIAANNLSDVANVATARQNLDVYAKGETYTQSEVSNLIATAKQEAKTEVKNEILDGASASYDTLLEIQTELQGNDTDIAAILSAQSNKMDKVTGATGSLARFLANGNIEATTLVASDVPNLSISKITSLQSTLDGKANLSGAIFTGDISTIKTVDNVLTVESGDSNSSILDFKHTNGDRTRMFFDAGENFALEHMGAEIFRINSSGNLGVGSSSPSFKTTFNYDANATFSNAASDFLQMWQNSGVNMLGVAGSDDQIVRLVTNNAYKLVLSRSGTDVLTMSSDARIGIKTLSPDAILHVKGDGVSNTRMFKVEGDATIGFQAEGAWNPKIDMINNGGNTYTLEGVDSGDAFRIMYNANSRFYIKSDGKIGMNTENPLTTLHVNGTITTPKIESVGTSLMTFIERRGTGIDGFGFYTNDAADGSGTNRRRLLIRRGGTQTIVRMENCNELSVDTGGGTGNLMHLDTNGLGIGTTSPGAKLEVRGETRINVASGNSLLRFMEDGLEGGAMYKPSGTTDFYIRSQRDLRLTVGGSTSTGIIVKSGGNVGFGTTNPLHKIHVVGGRIAGGSSTAPWTISSNGSDIFFNTGASNSAIFIRPNGDGSPTGQMVVTRDYMSYDGAIRSDKLTFRDDSIERHEGAGNNNLAFNYYGHNITHNHFRSSVFFNGKGSELFRLDAPANKGVFKVPLVVNRSGLYTQISENNQEIVFFKNTISSPNNHFHFFPDVPKGTAADTSFKWGYNSYITGFDFYSKWGDDVHRALFGVRKNTNTTSKGIVNIGGYYLWVDSLGRLRIHSSNPTSDTSGVVVGAQS